MRKLAFLAVFFCSLAHAQVRVVEPWVRATAPGQTVAAGYMTLETPTGDQQ